MRIEEEDLPEGAKNFGVDTRIGDMVPRGYMPIEFCIQVKAIGPDGETVFINGTSDGMTGPEAWGMVQAHANDLEDGQRRVFAK